MQLMAAMLPLLARLGSPILPSIGITLNDLTMRHGLCVESAVGVGLHAVSLWQHDRLVDANYMMRLAMHIPLRLGVRSDALAQATGVCCIFPWTLPLRECASIAISTADEVAAGGDLPSASMIISNAAVQAVLSGVSLDTAQTQIRMVIERHRLWSTPAPTLAHSYLWSRCVQRLQLLDKAGDDVPLEWRCGEVRSDLRLIEEAELDYNASLAWSERIACGIAAYFEGNACHALDLFEMAWSMAHRCSGFIENGALVFYYTLCICATLPQCPAVPSSGVSADDLASEAVESFSPQQQPNAAVVSAEDRAKVEQALQLVNTLIRKMHVWSSAAPFNHVHRLKLMQAERCLMCYTHLGSCHLALPGMRLMFESGELALRNGFLLEYALILERHYQFHLACRREVPARYWMAHAHQANVDAKCYLKVKQMEEAFPVLVSPSKLISHAMSAGNARLSQDTLRAFRSVVRGDDISSSPTHSPTIAFDLFSVLKATSALSTEKNEHKLLRRTMALMIQTAGASRGVLILRPRETVPPDSTVTHVSPAGRAECVDGWTVELEANVLDTETPQTPENAAAVVAAAEIAGNISASNSPPSSGSPSALDDTSHIQIEAPRGAMMEDVLPVSLLSFVVSAREPMMLTEPERETNSAFAAFSQDAYFQTHHPKAMLCTPLMRAGRVYGGLYLENTLNPDAFTSSHVQLLQLLCSQAALSIDNARLYARLEASHATLEKLVEFRTAELTDKNKVLQSAVELAEKASKIKSEFLSNMSHELRTVGHNIAHGTASASHSSEDSVLTLTLSITLCALRHAANERGARRLQAVGRHAAV